MKRSQNRQRNAVLARSSDDEAVRIEAESILLCVRWYLRYSLSYRDLEEMMRERVRHVRGE